MTVFLPSVSGVSDRAWGCGNGWSDPTYRKEVPAMSVTKGEVRKVIALRKKGATWPEVLEQLDKGPSFVFAVRKEMKTIDPESVRKSYDRQPKAKKVAAKKVTRKTRKVAVSA